MKVSFVTGSKARRTSVTRGVRIGSGPVEQPAGLAAHWRRACPAVTFGSAVQLEGVRASRGGVKKLHGGFSLA